MELRYYLKKYAFMLILLAGSGIQAQSDITTDQSIALKTIRSLNDIPVVYQNEIQGGTHQIEGTPWLGDDVESIATERLFKGMLVTNTDDGTTYRFTSATYTDEQNISANWERVYLISSYVSGVAYAAGEIVIDATGLYRVSNAVTASQNDTVSNSNYWSPLVDQFRINNSQIANVITPVNSTLGTTSTFVTGGTEIVLVNAHYTLPAASTKKGATFTIKNTKVATAVESSLVLLTTNNTSETVDGIDYSINGIELFMQYDYITLLCDGTQWYKIGGGSSKIAKKNEELAKNHLDAFYWGNPDEDGSWRIVYQDNADGDDDDTNDRLIIQKRDAGVWVNKTSIVP